MKRHFDYGCPDWTKAEAYGDVSTWDEERWRWEFKRRSSSYRGFFGSLCHDDHRERYPTEPMPIYPMWMPEYRERLFFPKPAIAAHFGFPLLANPLFSERPRDYYDSIRQNPFLGFEGRTMGRSLLVELKQGRLEESDIFGHQVIGVAFDLYRPIEPQLAGLLEYLREIQDRNAPKDIMRKQKDKWLRYLRLLDAREAQATWSECASILEETISGNAHAARDSHRQAVILQERL